MSISLPTIQLGTLLIASATFFGALIGSIIPPWLKRRSERRNIRTALRAEIDEMALGMMNAETLNDFSSVDDAFDTQVYETNSGKIGHLREDEAAAVIRLYSRLRTLDAYLRLLDTTEVDQETVNVFVERTINAKEEALEELK